MMSRLTQIFRNSVKTKIKRKDGKKGSIKQIDNEKQGFTPRSERERAKVIKGENDLKQWEK